MERVDFDNLEISSETSAEISRNPLVATSTKSGGISGTQKPTNKKT